MPRNWLRILTLVAIFALVVAACPADDDTPDVDPEAPETPTTPDDRDDTALHIGYILPESGPLEFLGAPQIFSVRLAIDDINEAGGVLGADVRLSEGDEAGDAGRVVESAQSHLAAGVHAVVGAASSAMTGQIIDLLTENQIVQCSASNTSPTLSDPGYEYYFRTITPDSLQAPLLADEITGDNNQSVAILYRLDDYGQNLAELVEAELEGSNVTVTASIGYDPEADTFDSEVQQATADNPDAYVVIAFDDGGRVIAGLLEADVTPDQLYGADGLFGPGTVGLVGAGDDAIDGMKVTGPSGDADYNERLNERLPGGEKGNFAYGGQAYDCAIIIALAAEAAGSVDPTVFVQEMRNVTQGGTECTSFAECKELLEQGEDINYVGASGNIELDDVGDPGFGRYAVAQFQDGGQLVTLTSMDVSMADFQ